MELAETALLEYTRARLKRDAIMYFVQMGILYEYFMDDHEACSRAFSERVTRPYADGLWAELLTCDDIERLSSAFLHRSEAADEGELAAVLYLCTIVIESLARNPDDVFPEIEAEEFIETLVQCVRGLRSQECALAACVFLERMIARWGRPGPLMPIALACLLAGAAEDALGRASLDDEMPERFAERRKGGLSELQKSMRQDFGSEFNASRPSAAEKLVTVCEASGRRIMAMLEATQGGRGVDPIEDPE